MKRQTMRRAGVVALALTSLIGVGSTAQADAGRLASSCASDFCLYEHDDYSGAEEEFVFGDYNVCVRSLSLNNKASSMRNPSGARVQFYDSANCSGAYGYAARPRSSDSDLTNNGFDNKTSSVKPVRP
ncbi:peptidase inhibitor family I36 protein [Nonomuraea sp. SMC257]|uniref:Peptidase inhibitor family I36 protein n=1 Tax=Nonomuraea montanisoli TaxID=2741721 RepID=A0A7Y6IDS0_9ACTN|nr:peptidase inhibitor family I36 protein [Nonomuraea montanisoli]NUW35768.1 peptidase inhibitor family I36 protein [Nonomuraea montanisoli]